MTPDERAALGKAARKKAPRTSQAIYDPPSDREDPVAILEKQGESRVQQLLPIRRGRMLVSPFTFYRGAAAIMAADLNNTPNSGLRVQACGDAHLSNFGAFASPERALVFDINDFDETNPGPWEWDLKRLVASIEIAGRNNGFTDAERRALNQACARSYRESMRQFAKMGNLQVWYSRLNLIEAFGKLRKYQPAKEVKASRKAMAKAQSRDSMQAMTKFTEVVDGRRQIVSQPPLIINLTDMVKYTNVDLDQVSQDMHMVLRGYRRTLPTERRHLLDEYDFVDMALKVVGVGSVGTRAWIILLQGKDSGDPLFLQAKEAQLSVLEPYCGHSQYKNAGQRVVAGQKLMQSASDIFLGWHRLNSPVDGNTRDYYVRQLRDWKASADVDTFDPRRMMLYAQVCGWTLAKAHARSGDRIALASYMGNSDVLDHAIADFADAYADQNEKDYEKLKAAVDSGQLEAQLA